MKKTNFFVGLLIVAFLVVQASQSRMYAQCSSEQFPINAFSHYMWTKETLNGNDTAYLSIRRNIDRMLAAGKKPVALAKSFQVKPNSPESKDSRALFRWAYASWRAFLSEKDGKKRAALLHCLFEATGMYDVNVERPLKEGGGNPAYPRHSYQYARLRLLLAMNSTHWSNNVNWVVLGKKMLARNPKDYELKFYLTKHLSHNSISDTHLAIRYAAELQKQFPQRPSSYSLLGEAYRSMFYWTRSSRMADKSIAMYRRYLQIAPASDEFRKYAPRVIQEIEKYRQRYKAQGKLKP